LYRVHFHVCVHIRVQVRVCVHVHVRFYHAYFNKQFSGQGHKENRHMDNFNRNLQKLKVEYIRIYKSKISTILLKQTLKY
jgi:hypothetical protein